MWISLCFLTSPLVAQSDFSLQKKILKWNIIFHYLPPDGKLVKHPFSLTSPMDWLVKCGDWLTLTIFRASQKWIHYFADPCIKVDEQTYQWLKQFHLNLE